MKMAVLAKSAIVVLLLLTIFSWQNVFGNGGPFVVKSPTGDPAAKGVLARLDPTLKPARETRLRVVKEDLTIKFESDYTWDGQIKMPPLVKVSAEYFIENPTDKEVQVDFGFPILRGIYIPPLSMFPSPAVSVFIDDPQKAVNASNDSKPEYAPSTVIANSIIYGIIRQNARVVIEQGIASDEKLAKFTSDVRNAWVTLPSHGQRPADLQSKQDAKPRLFNGEKLPEPKEKRKPTADYLPSRKILYDYLLSKLKWKERDALLFVEYAGLDLGHNPELHIPDRWDQFINWRSEDFQKLLITANLGPLAAIGEQKSTQMFAQLASRFDKDAGTAYEAIFTAWGGDVRERSIDMKTGELRPRELILDKKERDYSDQRLTADPTVYARVDYLDPNAKISKEEKDSCLAILKNLPVVFTFAPMNLLHYQVKFPPHSNRTVTVSYIQYGYADTREPESYQLAYVLHPATMWKEFGPINLTLQVPKGIDCKASVPLGSPIDLTAGQAQLDKVIAAAHDEKNPPSAVIYKTVIHDPEQKKGELFIGINKEAWDKMFPPTKQKEDKQQKPKPVRQQAAQESARQTTPQQ